MIIPRDQPISRAFTESDELYPCNRKFLFVLHIISVSRAVINILIALITLILQLSDFISPNISSALIFQDLITFKFSKAYWNHQLH